MRALALALLALSALLAAPACSKIIGLDDVTLRDAGPPDTEPPDAPPTSVRVTALTYTGDGMPDLSVRMLFQDPEGNVVLEGPVDGMGKLEAELPRGGTVTAIRIVTDTAAMLRAELTTILGVRAGDDLTIGLKARPTITNQGGQTTMSASYLQAPGAANHQFFTTCGVASAGTTSPVTLNFRDSCHGPTFDLVGVASGGSLTTPRFVKVGSVDHQNGQTFNIPAPFAPMGNFTVNVTNVPAEIASLTVARASMLEHTAIAAQSVALGDPPAGTVSVDVPFATGVGTRSQVSLTLSRSDAVGTQQHNLHTQALEAGVAIDLGRQQVPWLRNVSVTASGMAWEPAVQGDAPDGMMIVWSGRWTDGVRLTNVGWRIAHAPGAAGLTLPRLPAAHAAIDPQAQTVAVTPNSGTVLAVDHDVVDGYDGFRQQPDTLLTSPIDNMGAFLGQPLQRRLYTVVVIGP